MRLTDTEKKVIDLEIEKLNYEVDVIYSNSVLEHVSINDIKPLIQNLTDLLKPKGKMIHRIHLEDHKNISNDPFGFLSIPEKQYPPLVQSKRGNRVRKSKWLEVFNNIEGLQNKLFYEWIRKDRDIPSTIDKSIGYKNEEDLLVSHIGIYSEKQSI